MRVMGAPLLAPRLMPGCLPTQTSPVPHFSLANRPNLRRKLATSVAPLHSASHLGAFLQPASLPAALFSGKPKVLQQQQSSQRSQYVPTATATAELQPSQGSDTILFTIAQVVQKQLHKYTLLGGKFMPMVGLFFLLAFVNTILDSLKDTLVITAVGGGANVIPYLTVYAVLPSSLIFLVLYSLASQRMSRRSLFNVIVAVFMSFFVVFATVLYPNHQAIHLDAVADNLAQVLPAGLGGLVGMVRNWTFTLFFCMSELWGDVCLGLLFWGLANDITSLSDAATLYPLFGLGANVAQALAGFVLKYFSAPASATASFSGQIQSLMTVVMVFSAAALGLHHYIAEEDKRRKAEQAAERRQASLKRQSAASAFSGNGAGRIGLASASMHGTSIDSNGNGAHLNGHHAIEDANGVGAYANGNGVHANGNGAYVNGNGVHLNGSSTPATSDSYSAREAATTNFAAQASTSAPEPTAAAAKSAKSKKEKPSLKEIFKTLSSSTAIQCLAVMSMAQGLCSSLMEFAWKSHIRLLYPSPAEFTSFLGDVSTWQGVVTGCLMVLSPTMFEKLGWKGVAGATPNIMLFGGGAFFAACLAYQFIFLPATGATATVMAAATLKVLVIGGALLYVFSKSAKFSLFKPAEEMVYISLDQEGRTKGKAAIDVVGSQFGKSGGSMMQQALLLVTGGAIAGTIPIMAIFFIAMTQGWLGSVNTLAQQNNYGHEDSVHARQEAEENALQAEADAELVEQQQVDAVKYGNRSSNGHNGSNGYNGNGLSSNGNGNGSGPYAHGNGSNGYGDANGNGSGVHVNGYTAPGDVVIVSQSAKWRA